MVFSAPYIKEKTWLMYQKIAKNFKKAVFNVICYTIFEKLLMNSSKYIKGYETKIYSSYECLIDVFTLVK